MSSQTFRPQDSPSSDEIEVRALYQQLLDGWNKRSADAFAALFAEDGNVLGFDGSQMTGRAEIASANFCRPSHSSLCEQSQRCASFES